MKNPSGEPKSAEEIVSQMVQYEKGFFPNILLGKKEIIALIETERKAYRKWLIKKLPLWKEVFDKSDTYLWTATYTRLDNAKVEGYNAALNDVLKVLEEK